MEEWDWLPSHGGWLRPPRHVATNSTADPDEATGLPVEDIPTLLLEAELIRRKANDGIG